MHRSIAHDILLLCALSASLALCGGLLAWRDAEQPELPLYPGDRVAVQGIQADPYIGWRIAAGSDDAHAERGIALIFGSGLFTRS